ncbi:MAG: HAD-IA family hydrolase, partial [Ignavibacteriae bacterium]|nr:HAD-IA family hydrolase [Ignavibacteriota bacterium]
MQKGPIENIIFDLGNTLVYFDFCYFYDRVALHEKNLNARTFKNFVHNKKYDLKITRGTLSVKEFFKILKRKFKLKIGYSDFLFFYSDIFWVNSSMKIFVEKIARIKRFNIFLLSNTDPVHINFIDRNFPFVRLFKKRVLSYKVRMNKPQKKIFQYVLQKYNLEPCKTLIIDDVKENIKVS